MFFKGKKEVMTSLVVMTTLGGDDVIDDDVIGEIKNLRDEKWKKGKRKRLSSEQLPGVDDKHQKQL